MTGSFSRSGLAASTGICAGAGCRCTRERPSWHHATSRLHFSATNCCRTGRDGFRMRMCAASRTGFGDSAIACGAEPCDRRKRGSVSLAGTRMRAMRTPGGCGAHSLAAALWILPQPAFRATRQLRRGGPEAWPAHDPPACCGAVRETTKPRNLCSANRDRNSPESRNDNNGFRVPSTAQGQNPPALRASGSVQGAVQGRP